MLHLHETKTNLKIYLNSLILVFSRIGPVKPTVFTYLDSLYWLDIFVFIESIKNRYIIENQNQT